MSAARRLTDAWLRWDRSPGSDVTSQALEDVIQSVAVEVGIPPTQLRVRIVAERRSGHSVQAAVKRVLA
jgi:CO/xanthine dehydrogenase Mo-binding subunit